MALAACVAVARGAIEMRPRLLVMLRRRERIDSHRERERERERERWKTHGDAIDRVNMANGGLRRRWKEGMVRWRGVRR